MAYNLTTLKKTLQDLLPPNSRIRISAHKDVNDKLLDYLYIPFGIAFPCLSATIPENCHICDGSLLNREANPYLFNAIGTIYGAGDGLTTFNLPFIPAGSSIIQSGTDTISSTVFTLGATGGEVKHKSTSEESGIPNHTHTINTTNSNTGLGNTSQLTGTNGGTPGTLATSGIVGGVVDASVAHNNMPPYIVGNWIMRLK
jgi:microcystin-dependent protein